MRRRPDLRGRVVRKLTVAAAVALHHVPDTSRSTFLALAEIARRADRAGTGAEGGLALTPFELRVFSQNGEDGVLAEILRRVGVASRFFVEIGAASSEANCLLLADVFGWHGLFLDASDKQVTLLQAKYASAAGVTVRQARVTPENIERTFAAAAVPEQLDVLSIDVDGDDYHLWEAVDASRPRIVVIEYNAALGAERELIQPRGETVGTAFYGASIRALESLAARKGYRLVHTELTGNNAFFVRDDLPGDFPPSADVPRRAPNYFLRGRSHRLDRHAGVYTGDEVTS